MSGEPTDAHGDAVHPTRTHEALHTCRAIGEAWADPFVDVVAAVSIAAVIWAAPDAALAQVAVGGITSVAVGKRYLARGGAA